MFTMAVERLQPLLTPEDVLVVVGEEQVDLLKAEGTGIPDRNYVIEPAGRGTAPAIALSAIALRRARSRSDHGRAHRRSFHRRRRRLLAKC